MSEDHKQLIGRLRNEAPWMKLQGPPEQRGTAQSIAISAANAIERLEKLVNDHAEVADRRAEVLKNVEHELDRLLDGLREAQRVSPPDNLNPTARVHWLQGRNAAILARGNRSVERFAAFADGSHDPRPDGEWVHFTDYENLEDANKRLIAEKDILFEQRDEAERRQDVYERDVEWWKKEARVWREAAEKHLANYEETKEELDFLAKETSFEPGQQRPGGLPGEKATVVDHVLEQFGEVGRELMKLESERDQAKAQALAEVRRALLDNHQMRRVFAVIREQHPDLYEEIGSLALIFSNLEDTLGEVLNEP